MKPCEGLQSITNLTKEIPLIYCFTFCIFLHWPALVKLLIMFYYSLMLIKMLLLLKIILFYHFRIEFSPLCPYQVHRGFLKNLEV